MIAKFDKAAKDHLETKHLAGEGDSLWTAQVDPKTSARSGRTLELTVDACSLYWFDRDSGQAIGRGPSDRTQAQLEARLAPA